MGKITIVLCIVLFGGFFTKEGVAKQHTFPEIPAMDEMGPHHGYSLSQWRGPRLPAPKLNNRYFFSSSHFTLDQGMFQFSTAWGIHNKISAGITDQTTLNLSFVPVTSSMYDDDGNDIPLGMISLHRNGIRGQFIRGGFNYRWISQGVEFDGETTAGINLIQYTLTFGEEDRHAGIGAGFYSPFFVPISPDQRAEVAGYITLHFMYQISRFANIMTEHYFVPFADIEGVQSLNILGMRFFFRDNMALDTGIIPFDMNHFGIGDYWAPIPYIKFSVTF